jgi:hypothetical protein
MTTITATYVYHEGTVIQTLSRFDAAALEEQFDRRPGARAEHRDGQVILTNSPGSPLAGIIIDLVDASDPRHGNEEK